MQRVFDRRIRTAYTTNDFYISYTNKFTSGAHLNVNLKLFRAIFGDYMKEIMRRILFESREVKLPAKLGYLSVAKKKPKRYSYEFLRVDFKSTLESGKTIYHMNEHCDGYNYSFYWRKFDMRIRNKALYELVMTRGNKRTLASLIKENKQDYLEKR